MMGFTKFTAVWLALGLAVAAGPLRAETPPKGESAPTHVSSVTAPLGDAFKVPNLLAKEQTRVVFYRDVAEANQKARIGAVSIFIDGVYHASIQQGGYADICLPPGKVEVAARYIENKMDVTDPYDVVNSLDLRGGEEVFVKVFDQPRGHAVMMVPRPERALEELVKTRKQLHTISRVAQAQECRDRPKEEAKPVDKAPRTFTLGADALFAFGKSDIDSVPPRGHRILDRLVDRILAEFGSGQDVLIHITGHADPFGSDASNLKLSRERAATIKTYLVNGGLVAQNITTEGRGSREPVVTDCGKQKNAKNVACNKPNRRVVLDVRVKQDAQVKN